MSDLVQAYVIGTAADCDVCIHGDEYVSARHARVFQDRSGQVWVDDLGSTNGTYLIAGGHGEWGQKVTGPTRVQPGDIVRVGRTKLPHRPPS